LRLLALGKSQADR